MDTQKICKIKLSDGAVYYIYDADAARISDVVLNSGGTITGNLLVDGYIEANHVKVSEIMILRLS